MLCRRKVDGCGLQEVRFKNAWMRFRELGGILCMQRASLRVKSVMYKACVRSILTYGADTWAMKGGMFQRL